jgi:hypothetical protein
MVIVIGKHMEREPEQGFCPQNSAKDRQYEIVKHMSSCESLMSYLSSHSVETGGTYSE